jgi:YHS domain-containing protein
MKKTALAWILVFVAPVLAGDVKPYPLSTCIVSDEPLDDSRHPLSVVHQGQEVKVCCRECRADFKRNPEEFLKKIPSAE